MSKADNKFVNVSQNYELEDWLYRNHFSKRKTNVQALQQIIVQVKGGNTAHNLSRAALDEALLKQPALFSELSPVGG
ncbi:hypothetical protein GKQ23_16165 [Erwinia sp. E602]|uniref:hypothetical protein n=1 Tax=Erwinia sp. E602 TaxID=2675378 RepID=UPI001BA625E4|nr:hypothetical protein [Erwinia sp. E602]QUG76442.1 hypothetical protein GKQ23_16165 [Erwinia sp. E602]